MTGRILRYCFVMVAALLFVSTTPVEAQNIEGNWVFSVTAPEPDQAPSDFNVTLSAEEGVITGTFEGTSGTYEMTGSLDSEARIIRLAFTIERDGNTVPVNFTGEVHADHMEGEVEFGGLEPGLWRAVRR